MLPFLIQLQVKRKKTTGSCSEAKRNLEGKKAIGAGEEERITEVDGNLMGSIIAQEIIIIIIIILEIDTASLKSLQLLEFEYMSGLPSYFVKPNYHVYKQGDSRVDFTKLARTNSKSSSFRSC
ncbi:uncharacterized protein [Rutidosis leptorrhynchoides]|uniref:uncharacterized protein isoform X1 n=1 Tax=Rutidosis leptorrhynchoides TaxID=125765 RepID=UPI003A9A59EA